MESHKGQCTEIRRKSSNFEGQNSIIPTFSFRGEEIRFKNIAMF